MTHILGTGSIHFDGLPPHVLGMPPPPLLGMPVVVRRHIHNPLSLFDDYEPRSTRGLHKQLEKKDDEIRQLEARAAAAEQRANKAEAEKREAEKRATNAEAYRQHILDEEKKRGEEGVVCDGCGRQTKQTVRLCPVEDIMCNTPSDATIQKKTGCGIGVCSQCNECGYVICDGKDCGFSGVFPREV